MEIASYNAEIINGLKSSKLVAECPHCSEEFELSKAILFDGLGKFPDIAEQKRNQLLEELKDRIEELKKRKISVAGAEKKAVEVGVGKIIEKVLPAYRDFKLPFFHIAFLTTKLVKLYSYNSSTPENIRKLEIPESVEKYTLRMIFTSTLFYFIDQIFIIRIQIFVIELLSFILYYG